MTEQQPRQNQIQIKASDEILRGTYSNAMQVLHTKQEFVLDFMNIFPPTGTLNSRVILSPGHFKRMTAAMADALKKYEEQFGDVEVSDVSPSAIGFQVKE